MTNKNLANKIGALTMGMAASALLMMSPIASAKNEVLKFSIDSALAKAQASGKLTPGVRLFFGKQSHPKPTAQFGEARTNKKTNFFNKTDLEACEWTFLSAMMTLTQYAHKMGGNAIVNIRSNYKNNEFSSETQYNCGAGAMSGGTAFVGDVVRLP